jgi:hypothetical protein
VQGLKGISVAGIPTLPAEAIGWRWPLLVFALGFFAVVSHRPDALFNPQFFGEDGAICFPEAYMFGWANSLLHLQSGYFQTLPRLAAGLALLVPLRFAPLLMNLVGITFQVLPMNVLLSSRCRNWGPLWARALMAIIYVGLPNMQEVDAAVVNGQWHLALLACLLVLACIPETVRGRICDVCVMLLSGLTGPFCIILLPIAGVFWWLRRERWRLALIGVLAVTAAVQLSALASAAANRPQAGLGAGPKLFLEILGGQIYLGALAGAHALPMQSSATFLVVVALLGAAMVVYCLFRAPLELRLFICFAFLVFAASLRNPMMSITVPQWQVLRDAYGARYWFFPLLGFSWALIGCLTSSRNAMIQSAAVLCFLAMGVAIVRDWQYPAYTDFHFQDGARQFESARAGEFVSIPIFPDGWAMRVTKKGPPCESVPIGRIRRASAGSNAKGPLRVRGWVGATVPIVRISILLDGSPVQYTVPSGSRPDVDSLYPWLSNKNKGWSASIDLSGLSPGTHRLSAQALESGGCHAVFDVVRIATE